MKNRFGFSVLKGPPKLYVEPAAPYAVVPGGNINITCAAVAYPFPEIYWQRYSRARFAIDLEETRR